MTGLAGGEWCPYGTGGRGPEFPADQREDDGRSLTWDSAPFEERLEILGAPVVELDLAVDRPTAFVAVRLCDVAPDGASTRATYGVLNLTHRDGHAEPRPMVPGERTRVRVQLNDTAYAFLPGHRLRLAISTDYWPMVWPSPEPVTLTVHGDGSSLELPVRPPRAEDARLRDLGEPEGGPPAAFTVLREGNWTREVRIDAMSGATTVTNVVDGPLNRLDRTGPGACARRLRPLLDWLRRPDDRQGGEPARLRDRARRCHDHGRRRGRPSLHPRRLPARRPNGGHGGRRGRLVARLESDDPPRSRLGWLMV